jgi:hypothetical protein
VKLVLLASKALPSSAIDLHPQSADIDFIAAKTRSAVASGNSEKKDVVFALNDDRPPFAFTGIWTEFKGEAAARA